MANSVATQDFNELETAGQLNQDKQQSRREKASRVMKSLGKWDERGTTLRNRGQSGSGSATDKLKTGVGAGMRTVGRGAKIADQAIDKAKSATTKSGQMALAKILQQAWINIIDTFGLSLIWVNIHAVLSLALPSVFCKLGEEWLTKMPGQKMSASTERIKKSLEAKTGIVEWMLLLALDFIVGIVLFALITIIVWMVDNIVFKAAANGIQVAEWIGGIID